MDLATEWVLTTVDSIHQSLGHDLLAGILREFDHEHTSLHSYVASIWLACKKNVKNSNIEIETTGNSIFFQSVR